MRVWELNTVMEMNTVLDSLIKYSVDCLVDKYCYEITYCYWQWTELLEARPEIEGLVDKYCYGNKYYSGSQQ